MEKVLVRACLVGRAVSCGALAPGDAVAVADVRRCGVAVFDEARWAEDDASMRARGARPGR
jgi:hypothetical protein